MAMIEWFDSEWADNAFFAVFNGILAHIDVAEAEEGWFYMVQAGPERCEYPEIVSCGTLPTLKDAQAMAEEKLLEADRTYQHIVYS
jgi:hypothetical protein